MSKKHDWKSIREYYDQGHSFQETQAKFGFANKSWYDARDRGEIVIRKAVYGDPIEKIATGEIKKRSRHNVKKRYIKAGLLAYECAACGISEWQGKPISLHLDHINGINDDDRLENVRLLCPNCHSQTETFGVKNRGSGNYNRGSKKKQE